MVDPMLMMRPSRLPPSIRGFEYVRELVRRNSAIVLDESKDYLIEARLAPLARELNLKSVEGLIAALRCQNPGKTHSRVVEALTTNETHFFRDIVPFRVLSQQVLPELCERNAARKTLRVWSAACSTGQEPYSIAMTIRDARPSLADWDVKILATDINETVLSTAQEGTYRALEVNRGLPASALVKHFKRTGAHFQVKEEVRRMCDFQKLNLSYPLPRLDKFDIVFLRNVLIYFEPEAKKSVLQRVAKSMKKDAYLFLGAAETTNNLSDQFARTNLGPGGCFQLKQE